MQKNISNACLIFSQCTFSKTPHISIYVIWLKWYTMSLQLQSARDNMGTYQALEGFLVATAMCDLFCPSLEISFKSSPCFLQGWFPCLSQNTVSSHQDQIMVRLTLRIKNSTTKFETKRISKRNSRKDKVGWESRGKTDKVGKWGKKRLHNTSHQENVLAYLKM